MMSSPSSPSSLSSYSSSSSSSSSSSKYCSVRHAFIGFVVVSIFVNIRILESYSSFESSLTNNNYDAGVEPRLFNANSSNLQKVNIDQLRYKVKELNTTVANFKSKLRVAHGLLGQLQHYSSTSNNNNNAGSILDSITSTSRQQVDKPVQVKPVQNAVVPAAAAPRPGSSSSPALPTDLDQRRKIKRPFMHAASHSIIDSIYDIERKYKYSENDKCNAWGGSKYIEAMAASEKQLLQNGASTILSYVNQGTSIYYAENVMVTIDVPKDTAETPPTFHLYANGEFVDSDAKSRMTNLKGDTRLTAMNKKMTLSDSPLDCSSYIDYPVMLVDHNIDTWNWWFFLRAIFHSFIAVAMVQPKVTGDYNQEALRVMFALNDQRYSRSFTDAFEFVFSDGRQRGDSRQAWKAIVGSGKDNQHKLCFRKLLWAPGSSPAADKILVNRAHAMDTCFSSLVYSYAAFLKASMHIPTLPRPEQPRVVWVGRDSSSKANWNSWQKQRVISNQDEVTNYLKAECDNIGVEFMVAEFYGDTNQHMPFQEQALFVSRANIMIGMHGAGLNLFHFMPFNSVVVEIHKGTSVQKNSVNYVKHIKEGKYFTMNAKMSGKKLLKEPVWDLLKKAIDEWKTMG